MWIDVTAAWSLQWKQSSPAVTFLAIRSPILTAGSPVVVERVWPAALGALLIISTSLIHSVLLTALCPTRLALCGPLPDLRSRQPVSRVFVHSQNLRKSGEGLELFPLGR